VVCDEVQRLQVVRLFRDAGSELMILVFRRVPLSVLAVLILYGDICSYHMQYYHGISSQTGFPFSPPLSFRVVDRPNPGKLERARLIEAKCHCRGKWVGVEGVKDVEMKVPELVWWKHAAACHETARLEGDTNIFLEDDIFRQALQLSGST